MLRHYLHAEPHNHASTMQICGVGGTAGWAEEGALSTMVLDNMQGAWHVDADLLASLDLAITMSQRLYGEEALGGASHLHQICDLSPPPSAER